MAIVRGLNVQSAEDVGVVDFNSMDLESITCRIPSFDYMLYDFLACAILNRKF